MANPRSIDIQTATIGTPSFVRTVEVAREQMEAGVANGPGERANRDDCWALYREDRLDHFLQALIIESEGELDKPSFLNKTVSIPITTGGFVHDVNDMLFFAHVVKFRSFSEAARRLDVSKSRVSKSIARLESKLGVRLLNRSTRSLSLTDVGEAYFEHCDRILEELSLADTTISRLHQEPRGKLKISAPVAFSTMHVASALPDFMARYPDLSVDLTISDRLVDLADEGYDIALRITREPGQNLVARQLAPIRRKICASPSYIARRGIPLAPEDLGEHNCLDYSFMNTQGVWQLKGYDGDVSIPVSGTLRINDDEALSQAVLGGLGLALLPTFIVGKDLQEGRLIEVLPGYVPTERFIYAIHLPNRHLPLKVRAFIEFLLERFGPTPYWDL